MVREFDPPSRKSYSTWRARITRCRAINAKPVLRQSAGTPFASCAITPAS